MRFYFNEVSIQDQFQDAAEFAGHIEALLAARRRSPALLAMRTTPALAERPVFGGRTVREVAQSWWGSPLAGALLAWVGKTGPFIEQDRLPEPQDLFLCQGVEVTDGGLGEAARRLKALEAASTMSFSGGDPDFGRTPLRVVHGFEDDPIASFGVPNYWTPDALIEAALALEPLPTSWRELIVSARAKFPRLVLPDAILEDKRLSRDPFDAVLRDRILALLSVLNDYMAARDESGLETKRAQEIVSTYFTGAAPIFSPESTSNQNDFAAEMTFPDPSGGFPIFAHWHGKIRHRAFRLHFEWPVAAETRHLKVLYIGPKLTKS